MLNSSELIPGSQLMLPELSRYTDENNYNIVSIHAGGMGICCHLKACKSGKDFALKWIRPELLGDEDSMMRFHDELEVWLSASACEGVAEAIGIARINEIPCVLAEWMRGGDLANSLPIFTIQDKISAILRITNTLSWIHKHLGVIHRDLKPANVLLDDCKNAYVADWGLARPLENFRKEAYETTCGPKNISRPKRTSAKGFLGTILYAAPEQLLDASSVDHRADIYALGCLMFEMETGSPPFLGNDFGQVAEKIQHEEAPRLGGFFKKTKLGLDHVIAHCLSKNPNERFQNYIDLHDAIIDSLKKRKFSVQNVQIGSRYERYQLGKGFHVLNNMVKDSPARAADYAWLEGENLTEFFKEADNLMSLGRYLDAEILLRGFYVKCLAKSDDSWHFGHTIAESYAYCLQNLQGRLSEAIEIYDMLNNIPEKAPEFYVNYSLALLRSGNPSKALDVCKEGLLTTPGDPDIIGNRTIAYSFLGDVENAKQSSLERLKIRRDVHSLEEAVSAISSLRKKARECDLPTAIQLAKNELDLIREGLELNPNFGSLRLKEIQLLRFLNAGSSFLRSCEALIHDVLVSSDYRQLAMVELYDELSSGEHFKKALEMIDRALPNMTHLPSIERAKFVKWKIYAEKYMIGATNDKGERIAVHDVYEFFTCKDGEKYRYPIMTARVLDWLSRGEEAEDIFREHAEHKWEARWYLTKKILRENRLDEARQWGQYLIQTSGWRAEAYDAMAKIEKTRGDTSAYLSYHAQGNSVFEKEMEIFRNFRQSERLND